MRNARHVIATLTIVVMFPAITLASHPSSEVEGVGEVQAECKSFKRNFFIGKSIGGVVEARGEKRKRRWWCLWLCKTREKVDADSIEIDNVYYSKVEGTPFVVESAFQSAVCTNTSKCRLRHFAFGIGVKIKFPSGDVAPAGVSDLLPLDGVVTRATVRVEGTAVNLSTAKGTHRD